MNKQEQLLNQVEEIANSVGFNVVSYNPPKAIVEDEKVEIEFSMFSPSGQDFRFIIEAEADMDHIIEAVQNYYDNFDVDEQAYLWIGPDGHGKNGAPYHIKEIVTDMEACDEAIVSLLTALQAA